MPDPEPTAPAPSPATSTGDAPSRPESPSPALRERLARSWSLWLAGVGPSVAEGCTDAEHRKLGAIGYTVLVPPVLGLFAAGYAASLLTPNRLWIAAIAVGWAFIVLTIDRGIVATYRESLGRRAKALQFVLRLAIAGLMALTISHPLTLLIFQPTVQREVERTVREDAKRDSAAVEAKISGLQNDIAKIQLQLDVPPSRKLDDGMAAESPGVAAVRTRLEPLRAREREIAEDRARTHAEVRRAEDEFANEVNGHRDSGRPGEGPIARNIKDTRIVPLTATLKALEAEETRLREVIGATERELVQDQAEDRAGKAAERDEFLAGQSRLRQELETEQAKLRAEVDRLREQQREIERAAEAEVAAMQPGAPDRKRPDLLQQTIALHGLFEDPERGGHFAHLAFMALLLLFLAVDAMPVLVKFSTKRGEYDEMVDHHHEWIAQEKAEERADRFPRSAPNQGGPGQHLVPAPGEDAAPGETATLKGVGTTAGLFLVAGLAGSLWMDSGTHTLPDHDYLPEIQALQQQGRLAEAITLANTVGGLPGMPHEAEILTLTQRMESDYNGWQRKTGDFVTGFLTGKADSGESFGGALISDFLIIGDLRDLGGEGIKLMRGEKTDPVLAALSAVGLTIDVATWVPEPTSTAAGLAAGPVVTVLKHLRKLGALTEPFADAVRRAFEACQRSKTLRPARGILDDFGGLLKQAPPGGMRTLLKHVESPEDLAAVSRWTAKNPEATFAALHVGGKDALEWMKRAGKSADAEFGALLRKGAPGFKYGIRGTKSLYRGRLRDAWQLFLDWLKRHPGVRLALLLLATGSLTVALLRVRRAGRWFGQMIPRLRRAAADGLRRADGGA